MAAGRPLDRQDRDSAGAPSTVASAAIAIRAPGADGRLPMGNCPSSDARRQPAVNLRVAHPDGTEIADGADTCPPSALHVQAQPERTSFGATRMPVRDEIEASASEVLPLACSRWCYMLSPISPTMSPTRSVVTEVSMSARKLGRYFVPTHACRPPHRREAARPSGHSIHPNTGADKTHGYLQRRRPPAAVARARPPRLSSAPPGHGHRSER